MIRIRLHLARVNRERIFSDQEGRQCLAFVCLDPADGEQRGKVAMSLSKEKRANGARGEICGSWQTIDTEKPASRAKGGRE
jgi:hypothetical protein